MLQYLTFGERRFGSHPMPPHSRLNWEFYAVIKGECAPLFPNNHSTPLKNGTLWIFPPKSTHGWKGKPGSKCQIVCMHFVSVPSPLRELAIKHSFKECQISNVQGNALLTLAKQLARHFEHPTDLTHLTYERALLELTFIALSDFKENPLPELAQSMTHKVNAGILWYQEHLHRSPKVDDVAAYLNISTSQLRKIFIQVLNESPQSVFMRLRLRAAMIMMSESNLKLEAVAEKCGYSSASHLTRAFIKEFKISPNSWRIADYSNIYGRVETHPWLGKDSWNPKKPFISTL